jgi:hypothetical protein
MHAELDNFGTGWYGVMLGLKEDEIDHLIAALNELKREKTHFHFRSEFKGDGGIGDVEIYYLRDEQLDNMELEASATPLRK